MRSHAKVLRILFNQKASPIEMHYFYDLIILLISLEILWVNYFFKMIKCSNNFLI